MSLLLRRLSLLLAFVALFALPAAARAQDKRFEQAIEEAGPLDTPIAQLETPVGELGLDRAELLAARHGQPIRLTLTLDRDVERGTLSVAIPRRWRTVPASGLRASTPARGRRVGQSREAVELVLDGARAGDEITAEIRDNGIPAGTWELPVSYGGKRVGHLELRLYAPVREESETPWDGIRAINVTNDSGTQSETFVTAVPGNPNRILVGANQASTGYDAWISNNGGQTWTRRAVPSSADVPDRNNSVTLSLCCDPMSAADAAGNIWYGGLSDGNSSRIFVSRIAAGTTTFVNTVGLPRRTSGTQDKPMMTIDNSPASPTFGRLYVVWNEPAGAGINVVMSMCDTRPIVAACDNADNWSDPISITKATGSYIYADVAVASNGRAYVTWWDFSNTNAVRGSVCNSNCGAVASWSSAQTIAVMNSTGGPLPFECPILAQPGGRASTAPGVEVDISGTATDGRVWVSWSDLRSGSGTTRCDSDVKPAATHLTFDSFATSAVGRLPGAASPSAQVATRLLADGEGGGAANSDDWFPWLAVDQTTGQAYVDFYSTRHDGTRRTTHFYVRKIAPEGTLGTLTRVSTAASNYSTNPCCGFGNDYGDYTGLDATGGFVFPVWSDKSTADGEALLDRVQLIPPTLEPGDPTITDTEPDGDADGVEEPGETLTLSIPVTNTGDTSAASTTGALSSSDPRIAILTGSAAYGTIAAGATAQPQAPYRIRIDKTLPCGTPIPLALTVTSPGQTGSRTYSLPTGTPCSIVPRAAITGPATAFTGQAVTFQAGASTDLDGTIAAYAWDLDGNGTFETSTGATSQAQTTYATPGARTVQVRVTDDDGLTDVASTTVTLEEPPNQPPVAAISGPTLAHSGDTVQFSAAGSSDPDGSIVKYEWDLDGDNAFETATGATPTIQTSFAAGGARTVRVRVTDNRAGTDDAATAITVNLKPVVSLGGPSSVKVAHEVQVTATASDADGTIANYSFDLDGNGSYETNRGTSATATTTFDTTGTKQIGVRVTDDDGAMATAVKSLEVVPNLVPIATLSGPDSARVDTPFEVSAAGSSDSDGSIVKYEFDLDNDGAYDTSGVSPTATTSFATHGPKAIKLRVTDDDGATAEATRSITIVANVPPTAVIAAPASAQTGETVTVDASGSSDSDGTVAGYEFDLDGDGTFAASTTNPSAQTTFSAPGTYLLAVRVTDNDGATASAQQSIVISAPPAPEPTVTATGTATTTATPAATATPVPPAPPAPPAAPVVALVEKRAKIRGGRVTLHLVGCAGCRGTIELRRSGRRLARKRYELGPNGTATVRVKLLRPRRMRVKAILRVVDATGRAATFTARLTIRR